MPGYRPAPGTNTILVKRLGEVSLLLTEGCRKWRRNPENSQVKIGIDQPIERIPPVFDTVGVIKSGIRPNRPTNFERIFPINFTDVLGP